MDKSYPWSPVAQRAMNNSRGLRPRHWGTPHCDDDVFPVTLLGLSRCARPPTGDWWRKRGAIYYEKKVFYNAKKLNRGFVQTSNTG